MNTELLSEREAALLEKYKEERAKRIRTDGLAQFRKTEGEFARFLDDPYSAEPADRAPMNDEVDVVIIGGGWSGLLAGSRLRQAGVDNFRIIESGGDYGGVWYWNRYPGARCDVESYIYLPLLEETGYMPTEKYATSDEIREYAQAVARHFDLYRHAVFQTRVSELRWDDAKARWIVSTNRGDAIHARFVYVGNGPLNYPKLPAIPGIEDFKGHSFHTCRWDYAYTGGDSNGNLENLKDKRVALIGTGCSAIQCMPALGESAKELYVVQRTPAVVAYRGNQPTDYDWAQSLEPGWHRARMANFESVLAGTVRDKDLVGDEWTSFWEPPHAPDAGADPREAAAAAQKMDIEKMDGVRARIDSTVKDQATAESLKPYYNRYCKRPTFNDEYLPAFNLPNVTLVDTKGKGLTRVTENEIVFEDQSYEVDCIIYATGFEAVTTSHKTGGFEIIGRDGETIDKKWAKAVRSLHGIYTHGFPNLFFVAGLRQGAPTLNFPYMMDEQAIHAAGVVKRMLDDKVAVMEVKQQAEERWGNIIIEKSTVNLEYMRECTPSILNAEGHLEELGKQTFTTAYGGGPFEYIDLLRDWREGGFQSDLHIAHDPNHLNEA
ncbi:NAD(P)/FAD-dependent oxidoreductase [Burkholderia sp. Bp8963]|uniref:flavin-containing monooxygenase n=1 Tax=Burkholderia sp. Bp8963 TaxID=2184547 RepID=UPI000F597703|nr:NAD(P)/FAD-dependent oxidoreductase [Burkholderia sp. Bp8963]RQS67023.1 NAD(P)/FAD-dependent oxidoreductase [Burkholderia sp. Bp8963]